MRCLAIFSVLLVLLALGCLRQAPEAPPAPATTVKAETTSIEAASTVSTLPTTSVETTSTIGRPRSCLEYCLKAGFADGVCTRDGSWCRARHSGVYKVQGNRFCPAQGLEDSCCCVKK